MAGIVNIVGHPTLGPDHAESVPFGRRLPAGKIDDGAEALVADKPDSVNRALVPVGRRRRVDPLQNIHLAAGWPTHSGNVVAQEPASRPKALRLRHLSAHFEAAVLEAEQPLRL